MVSGRREGQIMAVRAVARSAADTRAVPQAARAHYDAELLRPVAAPVARTRNAAYETVDSGRWRCYRDGAPRSAEYEAAKTKALQALRLRSEALGKPLREENWQLAAAAEILIGGDLMITTATASGKSFVFQLPVITDVKAIILVLCPLINLMWSHVEESKKLDITACAINATTLLDHGLVRDVARGRYQLVFASPEFCQYQNKDFVKLTRDSAFQRRLKAIVVDEAHLVHDWRKFRNKYTTIGGLRAAFKCSMVALTATASPWTRRFTHTTLKMARGATFIRRKCDRPSIYYSAAPMRHPVGSFKDLDFLIPDDVHHDTLSPRDLPQSIVFMDERRQCLSACNRAWDQVPPLWRQKYPLALREVTTAMSDDMRLRCMQAFADGTCRIMFATEVAGLGINFPHCVRVVQYSLATTLHLGSMLQRFGRCARQPGTEGVAILLYTANALIRGANNPLDVLCDEPSLDHTAQALRLVEEYATTESGKSMYEWQDHLVLRVDAGTIETGLDFMIDAAAPRQEPMDDDDEPEETCTDADAAMLRDVLGDEATMAGPPSDTDYVDDPQDRESYIDPRERGLPRARARRKNVKNPALCRGLLWFVNTPGCRRRIFWDVFDEVDRPDPESESIPHCCDHCRAWEDLPRRLRRLLPPDLHDGDDAVAEEEELDAFGVPVVDDEPDLPRRNRFRPAARAELFDRLVALRGEIYLEEEYHGQLHCPYNATTLLPDKDIWTLLKHSGPQTTEAEIRGLFRTLNICKHVDVLLSIERIASLFASYDVDSPSPPPTRGARGARGRPRMPTPPRVPPHASTDLRHAATDEGADLEADNEAYDADRAKWIAFRDARRQRAARRREESLARQAPPVVTRDSDDIFAPPTTSDVPSSPPAAGRGGPSGPSKGFSRVQIGRSLVRVDPEWTYGEFLQKVDSADPEPSMLWWYKVPATGNTVPRTSIINDVDDYAHFLETLAFLPDGQISMHKHREGDFQSDADSLPDHEPAPEPVSDGDGDGEGLHGPARDPAIGDHPHPRSAGEFVLTSSDPAIPLPPFPVRKRGKPSKQSALEWTRLEQRYMRRGAEIPHAKRARTSKDKGKGKQ